MSSRVEKVEQMSRIMERVYGPVSGRVEDWSPLSFEENKSRYLWTDAFGVVNFLTLYSETKNEKFLGQAKKLMDVVHSTLGKTRDGQKRLGAATVERPLLGGLRIGKPGDEGSGMNQDGQYYHYLTKWMFALNIMSKVTGEQKYNDWAVDLARSIHPHFVRRVPGQGLRMFWKLSIDLGRPLVNSEGGLDPYDGYATYSILQGGNSSVLESELGEMREMTDQRHSRYQTNDCLDAGEALWLAHLSPNAIWAPTLLQRASAAVNRLWDQGYFSKSANHRLAFREFGTTIGVQMHPSLREQWAGRLESLHGFWSEHLFQRDSDISPVMFCASLMPGYFAKDYKP